jgi:hypothetical protein
MKTQIQCNIGWSGQVAESGRITRPSDVQERASDSGANPLP